MVTERIAPAAWMLTAPNPGPKTLDGTHTYIVGSARAVVIDPGPDDGAYQATVAACARALTQRVSGILLTHSHPDHASGAARLSALLGVPVWLSRLTDTFLGSAGTRVEFFEPHQVFDLGGRTLSVLETPGHSRDHVSFLLQPDRIGFVGDTILGRGSALVALPEGNLTDYAASLRRLGSLDLALIAPGHGPLISSPSAKIDEYIAHRAEREQAVLAAIGEGATTTAAIVERVYIGIDPELIPLAALSVGAQLDKLTREERIRLIKGRYVCADA